MDYSEYLDYFLSNEKRDSFQIAEGKGKVMISAPHSVEHTREGVIRYGEYQTGILARLLNDHLNCPAIFKTCNYNDDANYDSICPYKESLCRYVKQHDILYVLDLHQLAPWREQDIDIGTARGRNIKLYPDLLKIVSDAFSANGLQPITVDSPFVAAYPFTVSAYVSERCAIPCIQIEINSRLVCEEYPEYKFETVLGALENIVNTLNGANNDERLAGCK